jgi:hypothetical protein
MQPARPLTLLHCIWGEYTGQYKYGCLRFTAGNVEAVEKLSRVFQAIMEYDGLLPFLSFIHESVLFAHTYWNNYKA